MNEEVVQGTHQRLVPRSFAGRPIPASLPTLVYRGKIDYFWSASQVDQAADYILGGACPRVVGFDIEWTVTYQRGVPPPPVALVQFCFVECINNPQGGDVLRRSRCFLLHICHSGITPKLADLLCCSTIFKVGVGIRGDSLKLGRDFGLEMRGVVDLKEMANGREIACVGTKTVQSWSLAALTELVLRCKLPKDRAIRCSNWEVYPLSRAQQQYAAADAWASLRLHEHLSTLPVGGPTHQDGSAGGLIRKVGGINNDVDPTPREEASKNVHVAACHNAIPLQPAKAAVLGLHLQGLDLATIAEQRMVRVETVQSYIAEAIVAGHAYNWAALEVNEEQLARIDAKTRKVLQENIQESNRSEAVGEATKPQDLLHELLAIIDGGIRCLMENIFPNDSLSYGELRLALAHLGRQKYVQHTP